MSSKTKASRPTYRCAECGWTTSKWVGRCGECQAWGTVDVAGGERTAGRTAPAEAARPA
ncbi:MAG: DNA repair protein RadA, partial [Aeromicrobium sp.]